ncbi:MAG: dynamin family protein [Acidobacteriota bacterium]
MTDMTSADDSNATDPSSAADSGQRVGSFIDYRKTELSCVKDLSRLRDLANKLGLSASIVERIDQALTRTEENRFSIAVVGEFKRGKSTFINALLGREILPADVLPCSATLNRITYGPTPSAQIQFRSEDDLPGRIETVPIDQLAEYVTKLTPESETTAANVEMAVITYPSEYCRNNVDIIDTPGLNDEETMTEVTLSVLPTVDAAIMVIMPESPFAGSEGDFLTQHLLLEDLGRVIFVVTAIDRIPDPAQQERIVEVIGQRISTAVDRRLTEQFGADSEEYRLYRGQIGIPKVFAVSGYQALQAQINGDEALLEQSSFPTFTNDLESFLVEGRGVVTLQVLVNRILDSANEITKKIHLEIGAMDMAKGEFDQRYAEASRELEGLRERREQETAHITRAARHTRDRLHPLISQLEDDLRRAVESTIDDATIHPKELNKERLPALSQKIGKKVSAAVGLVAHRTGERIQLEIEKDLRQEATRLQVFAEQVGETLGGVVEQFSMIEADPTAPRNAASESLAAAISVFTGFGGIWSGYREAGAKGAAVGGAASVGTAMAGGVALAIAGAPITLPAVLIIGVASIFTGGLAARTLLGGTRVDNFKKSYKEKVLEFLDEQLRDNDLANRMATSIDEVYARLENDVMGEITDTIEQTQANLDDLKNKKASDVQLSESHRNDLEDQLGEVTRIREQASRLSLQLADIRHV